MTHNNYNKAVNTNITQAAISQKQQQHITKTTTAISQQPQQQHNNKSNVEIRKTYVNPWKIQYCNISNVYSEYQASSHLPKNPNGPRR